MYVFTSEKDVVLRFGVSTLGTADREFCGACAAGLSGFHLGFKSSGERRRQDAKIDNIEWRAEFARFGNLGGHTDTVDARFIRRFVAPLLMQEGPRFVIAAQPAEAPPADDTMQNGATSRCLHPNVL